MKNEDGNTEEMLRILLKLIILKSTRIWKLQHQLTDSNQDSDVQFLRKFSQLVERHFKTHHTVGVKRRRAWVRATLRLRRFRKERERVTLPGLCAILPPGHACLMSMGGYWEFPDWGFQQW